MSDARIDIPGNSQYGEGKRLDDAQANTPTIRPETTGIADPQPLRDFGAPSEAPGESLFAGSRIGPGPGPEALQMPNQGPTEDEVLAAAILPTISAVAGERKYASSRFRQMVRKMRSEIPPELIEKMA